MSLETLLGRPALLQAKMALYNYPIIVHLYLQNQRLFITFELS